jgi:DNA topoisomerase-1
MNLVIVESPTKAKTINKYLGSGYKVISSFGHIRDLPSRNGSVRPEEDFAMDYEINDKAVKHVKEIVSAAKNAKKIYLASDPDREGEAIAWHVVEVLKAKKALVNNTEIKRIVFHEITKKSVQEAIEHPRDIDSDLVNAQQARRALDYLVGFNLSPVLWRKLPGSKSAGRVQSVALRLICEREDEIDRFISQDYWKVKCNFTNTIKNQFWATLTHLNSKKLEKFHFANQNEVNKIVSQLKEKQYTVSDIEKKQQKRNPYPPFITSSLQQEASRKLGFSAKKTMQVAQKLYEGVSIDGESVGLITYMRTDGTQLSSDSVTSTREFIEKEFGKQYLPESTRIYKTTAKNAQEAHEAIRPTNINLIPKVTAQYLESDQQRLYELIWKRTVACQMENALIDLVGANIITNDNYAVLRATGSTMVFDGFYRLYKEDLDDSEEEENLALPPLSEGEKLSLNEVLSSQHATEPPPRYSEASLVKKLEELGIGRPSTYASIISVLQERNYVILDKKRFLPEERGRLVTAFLIIFFKKYVEYGFTADLEEKLDKVSDGQIQWKKLLQEFWSNFNHNIEEVQKYDITHVINELEPLVTEHIFPKNIDSNVDPKKCPSCANGVLGLKIGKFGPFVGCSNYPECKYTHKIYNANSEEDQNNKYTENHFENKEIGKNADGIEVLLKKGPYGFYIQLGSDGDKKNKPKRSSIPKFINIDNLDLKIALDLLSLPRNIGKHSVTGKIITAGIGKFGAFLNHDGKYASLVNQEDVFTIDTIAAESILSQDKKSTVGSSALKSLGDFKGTEIVVHKGRYGPYIKYGKTNISTPKNLDQMEITPEQAQELVTKHLNK